MFLRREKLKIFHRLREWAWPTGGWLRGARYIMHRLGRMPGTSYSIAAGFACGAAVSFTPFVGTHFLWAALLAWVVRGNIIVALIGTIVGNPWTFPFIWIWLFESGNWLIKGKSEAVGPHPDFYSTFSHVTDALLRFDLDTLIDSAAPVIWPMFLSGIPTAVFVWFIVFVPLKKMIDGYQHRRHIRRTINADKGSK